MLPLFLKLNGRRVVLVGDGPVAEAKRRLLETAGAELVTVAPTAFRDEDLDGAWLAIAAASPEVNARVARAAETRRLFLNAADDPPNASAYLSGVVQRGGVSIAISTEGAAPALTALLREALEMLLPQDVDRWFDEARRQRTEWQRGAVPFDERRPLLLEALNLLYAEKRRSASA